MVKNIIIEVCCGSVEDVITAISQPIDRIELNSALELGGLTPSLSTLTQVKQITNLPICCMARCRTGGFCYSDQEYKTIFSDAKVLLDNGADGVVFGFLNPDRTINIYKTKEMVELIHSYHKEAIFHKAFDETIDLIESGKALINCGVDRVLTSGGLNYPDITKGIPTLKQLEELYGQKLQILAGGGVRSNNISKLVSQANLKQIHMSASTAILDPTSSPTYNAVNSDKLIDILKNL